MNYLWLTQQGTIQTLSHSQKLCYREPHLLYCMYCIMHIFYGIGCCLGNLASSTLFLFASHTCFLSRNCLAHSVSPCSSRNFMAFVSKPLVRRAGRSTLFSRQRANRGEGLYSSSIAGQCRPDPHVLLNSFVRLFVCSYIITGQDFSFLFSSFFQTLDFFYFFHKQSLVYIFNQFCTVLSLFSCRMVIHSIL